MNDMKQWFKRTKGFPLGMLIALVFMTACIDQPPKVEGIWEYREFIQQVEANQVEKVSLSRDRARALATRKDGKQFLVNLSTADSKLIETLTKHNVDISVLTTN